MDMTRRSAASVSSGSVATDFANDLLAESVTDRHPIPIAQRRATLIAAIEHGALQVDDPITKPIRDLVLTAGRCPTANEGEVRVVTAALVAVADFPRRLTPADQSEVDQHARRARFLLLNDMIHTNEKPTLRDDLRGGMQYLPLAAREQALPHITEPGLLALHGNLHSLDRLAVLPDRRCVADGCLEAIDLLQETWVPDPERKFVFGSPHKEGAYDYPRMMQRMDERWGASFRPSHYHRHPDLPLHPDDHTRNVARIAGQALDDPRLAGVFQQSLRTLATTGDSFMRPNHYGDVIDDTLNVRVCRNHALQAVGLDLAIGAFTDPQVWRRGIRAFALHADRQFRLEDPRHQEALRQRVFTALMSPVAPNAGEDDAHERLSCWSLWEPAMTLAPSASKQLYPALTKRGFAAGLGNLKTRAVDSLLAAMSPQERQAGIDACVLEGSLSAMTLLTRLADQHAV